MKKLTLITLMLSCSCALFAQSAEKKQEKAPYPQSYAVVVDAETQGDSAWSKVTEALVKKHNATLIVYEKDVFEAKGALQTQFPKYVCFVRKPDDIKANFVAQTYQLCRQLDDDPYGDAIHGILTGYTAEDAMRVITAEPLREVNDCLAQTSVGHDRYRESLIVSDGEPDVILHKTPDGKIKKQKDTGDKTPYFVEFFEKNNPQVIITSSHGAQNVIEMPGGKGRIVSQDGAIWHKYSGKSTLDARTGQAVKKTFNTQNLAKVETPKTPNLFFAVGNCLVGEVNQRDCLVTAAFHSLNTQQFIGYTFTTWYGQMGHLTLRGWEQGGGYVPINEAMFFANQVIMDDLGRIAPELQTTNFENVTSHENIQAFAQRISKSLKKQVSRNLFSMLVGHMWDRDCVAFYGDPAQEIYLSKTHTFKPNVTDKLITDGDEWIFEMTAHNDCDTPNQYTAQRALFFPERIESAEIISGNEYLPVITDNFIMARKPGPAKKGKKMIIKFKVKKRK